MEGGISGVVEGVWVYKESMLRVSTVMEGAQGYKAGTVVEDSV